MRESPVAVAVGETPPQPFHPTAKSHVLRCVAAALSIGQLSVVQHCGGQEIQVQEHVFFHCLPCLLDFVYTLQQLPRLTFLTILCCSPVSGFASLNGETVAAGVVTCLIVYPLYLLVFTLFRMSRSKVTQTFPKLPQSRF